MNPNYILWAIPIFLVTIIAEVIHNYIKNKGKDFNFEDSITNLNIGIGSQAVGALTKAMVLIVYVWIYDNFRFLTIEPSWYSVLIAIVAFDYLFYWAHRWGHEVNFFWGAHIVHHQSEEYNLTVALRQSWFHNLIAFPIFLPIPFLGIDVLSFAAAAGIVTLYQYWFHTKAINRMPKWFEYIFNSPAHHRVHHATNEKYLDHNYAGMFIIFDRIHGTFIDEAEDEKCVYGITTQFGSWNTVWSNFHFYVEMWKGSKQLKTVKEKLALIVRGPEYLGTLLHQISEGGEKTKTTLKKYATETPLHLKVYVSLQFLLLTYFLTAYMGALTSLTAFYQVAFFVLICLSTLSISGIMENKPWFYIVEIARFLMFVPLYNLCYHDYFSDWFSITLPISIGISVLFTVWILGDLYVRKLRPRIA
ncbi:MAG: sterol desaturase family protein [Flavobacteriales bacterium]|nr:sterol desaturase family protein [Flavobacteriales bacterium]